LLFTVLISGHTVPGNITLPLYLILFLLSSTYFIFSPRVRRKTAGKTMWV
jgi:hypothetical protein